MRIEGVRIRCFPGVQKQVTVSVNTGSGEKGQVYLYHCPDSNLPPFFAAEQDWFERMNAIPFGDTEKEITVWQSLLFLSQLYATGLGIWYPADMKLTLSETPYLFPWEEVPVTADSDFGAKCKIDGEVIYGYIGTPFQTEDGKTLIKTGGEFLEDLYVDPLDGIFITSGLTGVKNGFIYSRRSLREIVLPDTVKRVGAYAFSGCRSLQLLHLPARCAVDASAFLGCGSMTVRLFR
jgi:hypothetical protein